MSELIPHPSRAASEARATRREKKVRAKARPAAVPRRGLIVLVFFLATVAAVIGGYLALHAARPTTEAHAAISVPPPAPFRALPAASPMARTEPAAEILLRETTKSVEPAPPAMPRHVPVAPRIAQKRVPEVPPVPSAPAVARFAAATQPPGPAPAVAPEVVKAKQEAPPPDRWQVMADTIARCGRDGFFAGVICEQRVRLQYCEGYWGQAAQCPSGIPNDHGG